MQLNRVVFPAPLGPTSPTLSPLSTVKSTQSTATTPPKDLVRPRVTRIGPDGSGRWSPSAMLDPGDRPAHLGVVARPGAAADLCAPGSPRGDRRGRPVTAIGSTLVREQETL